MACEPTMRSGWVRRARQRQRHLKELPVRAVDIGPVLECRGFHLAQPDPLGCMTVSGRPAGCAARPGSCPARARPGTASQPTIRNTVRSCEGSSCRTTRRRPGPLAWSWPSATVSRTIARSPSRSQYSTPAMLAWISLWPSTAVFQRAEQARVRRFIKLPSKSQQRRIAPVGDPQHPIVINCMATHRG